MSLAYEDSSCSDTSSTESDQYDSTTGQLSHGAGTLDQIDSNKHENNPTTTSNSNDIYQSGHSSEKGEEQDNEQNSNIIALRHFNIDSEMQCTFTRRTLFGSSFTHTYRVIFTGQQLVIKYLQPYIGMNLIDENPFNLKLTYDRTLNILKFKTKYYHIKIIVPQFLEAQMNYLVQGFCPRSKIKG